MAMPYTARRYTIDEVIAFPSDGNRYELVHGELLVTPAPRPVHQVVIGSVYRWLSAYLDDHSDVARLFLSPADISWADDELVQPDLFVVPSEEVSTSWTSYQTLLLAVEVVSPSSTRYDRVTKRRLYQERGVVTYWVVDPDARLVEVWHPEDERPQIVTDVLRWRLREGVDELVIVLEELLEALPTGTR